VSPALLDYLGSGFRFFFSFSVEKHENRVKQFDFFLSLLLTAASTKLASINHENKQALLPTQEPIDCPGLGMAARCQMPRSPLGRVNEMRNHEKKKRTKCPCPMSESSTPAPLPIYTPTFPASFHLSSPVAITTRANAAQANSARPQLRGGETETPALRRRIGEGWGGRRAARRRTRTRARGLRRRTSA
jgi:hypothetical protein